MKLWYALMNGKDDDWGTGTFDREDALRQMRKFNDRSEAEGKLREWYIAVIDGDYDEDGNANADPVCIEEITE